MTKHQMWRNSFDTELPAEAHFYSNFQAKSWN